MHSNRGEQDLRGKKLKLNVGRSKARVVGSEGVAPNVEVKMKWEISDNVSSFKVLGNRFDEDGGP